MLRFSTEFNKEIEFYLNKRNNNKILILNQYLRKFKSNGLPQRRIAQTRMTLELGSKIDNDHPYLIC